MVRSQEAKTGCKRTPVSHEGKEEVHEACACNHSRLPGTNMNGTNSPITTLTALNVEVCRNAVNTEHASSSSKGAKAQKTKSDRKYLGVRVRMPVKDMLRDIRIAKGMDPKDMQKKENKGSKGEKRRVNISSGQRNTMKNWQTKSLEELSIIVEVLEEDLKTSTFKKSPMQSVGIYDSAYSQAASLFTDPMVKDGSCESDYNIHRRWHEITRSPSDSREHVPSPHISTEMNWWGSLHKTESPPYSCSGQEQWNNMTYFRTQMEREAHLLNNIANKELLFQDEKGRTLLHRAVDEGKQSLVYVIARRMAHLNKLDSKDAEGKTSLHLAAQKNQHLVFADLISLGANVNERENCGKTCLHLSAEYGCTRVLEVLKSYMKTGTYIDLEARDVNGLSALQLASVALKNTVGDLEKSVTMGQARVHSLRKEHRMETLKYLLQMECDLQCLN